MAETNYNVHKDPDGAPIKMWTKGVPVEDVALQQLRNTAKLPFIFKHVAAMADCHWGKGSTVGSVIATKGAIVPACVGVDIGCGMMANRTSLKASDLPDNLSALRAEIERVVPHGRTNNGGPGDRGAWHNVPDNVVSAWIDGGFKAKLDMILHRHPKLSGRHGIRTAEHLGTLGTGNHFVEVCLDEEDRVWVMLHSGSRGLGNKIGMYFIERAKEDMRRWFINLPDEDLAYFPEGSDLFDDYFYGVGFAQDYAALNRKIMMNATMMAIAKEVLRDEGGAGHFWIDEVAVNCHHNYVTRESHFGENVLVTRKGAVQARAGTLGIIPGSMGTRSYIVRGKGNPESFHSCSHGAGRAMGRKAAERTISLEEHEKALAHVECRRDATTLDETPAAYKSIDAVMAAQTDLVEVVHTLRQVLCVKG